MGIRYFATLHGLIAIEIKLQSYIKVEGLGSSIKLDNNFIPLYSIFGLKNFDF